MVEQTLTRFKNDLQDRFGSRLHDLIVHGSIVLGDFRPNRGDIDFVALFTDEPSESDASILFDLFASYRDRSELLLHQLEGTFYAESAVKDPRGTMPCVYIGSASSSWGMSYSFRNSLMDLRLIAESGGSLFDRPIDVYKPSEPELLQEQRDTARVWQESLSSKKSSVGLAVGVTHWCARTILYRKDGMLYSKTAACLICAGKSELREFEGLLRVCANLRHPYPETIKHLSSSQAGLLLTHVTAMLRDC